MISVWRLYSLESVPIIEFAYFSSPMIFNNIQYYN
jgi:hypothetical protein